MREMKLKPTAILSILIAGLILRPSLLADHIVMTNGDRLSGTIVKSDDKGLTMKSEFAGTVTIQWDGVAEFSPQLKEKLREWAKDSAKEEKYGLAEAFHRVDMWW